MDSFQLDQRLANDCYTLGRFENSLLLLLNNSYVPWFIVVPDTDQVEFHKLDESFQLSLMKQSNELCRFIEQHFDITKINTGLIGNIVRQMHIHIIGRHDSDPYWPGVVWGQKPTRPYAYKDVEGIAEQIKTAIPDFEALPLLPKD